MAKQTDQYGSQMMMGSWNRQQKKCDSAYRANAIYKAALPTNK